MVLLRVLVVLLVGDRLLPKGMRLVGVVASADACSWPVVVAGLCDQIDGRVVVGGAFASGGVGWRSTIVVGVHEYRVTTSGVAADIANVVVTVVLRLLLWEVQLPGLTCAQLLLLVLMGSYMRLVVGPVVVLM
jgi:hypothetical protein